MQAAALLGRAPRTLQLQRRPTSTGAGSSALLLGRQWCRGSARLAPAKAASTEAPSSKEERQQQQQQQHLEAAAVAAGPSPDDTLEAARLARKAQRESERAAYKAAAISFVSLISFVAVNATYFRIVWHMEGTGGAFPWADLACTLLLVAGGMVGMEVYARFAHRAWHDVPLLWKLHASHHEPRLGPFEKNDLYAVINAVPAMALCLYGFLTDSLFGSMCFGAGLGITLFGMSYVFVHDGMVHRRFPVGPLAEVPYFKRVVLAHQLHHSEKYGGVPFGLFLGPQELEAAGAKEELDRMMTEAAGRRP